jgi:hypothetical protein
MTTEEIALTTIVQLRESASWEDIQERINFIVACTRAFANWMCGRGFPHDKVKKESARGV